MKLVRKRPIEKSDLEVAATANHPLYDAMSTVSPMVEELHSKHKRLVSNGSKANSERVHYFYDQLNESQKHYERMSKKGSTKVDRSQGTKGVELHQGMRERVHKATGVKPRASYDD